VEPTHLLWVDLETTGTDENQDPILEIGWALTLATAPFDFVTRDTVPLYGGYVIRPDGDKWTHRICPTVLEMHLKNGLLAEVFSERAVSIAEAESALIDELKSVGDPHDFVLAGSGVAHFDRRFIDVQMPKLSKWLRFYTIDVGILRRTLVASGAGWVVERASEVGKLGDAKRHRALDDILAHLNEARQYADFLGKMGAHE
jgi:oligoribonuclease